MINKWHSLLQMPKHDKAWHENDLADELAEYAEETKLIMKWSELSDVVYTCTRGKWSGHQITFPLKRWQYYVGIVYMIPKYTLRWWFFKRAGKRAGSESVLHEVRNPKKTHKLNYIAEKYNLDSKIFQEICEKQLKHWVLLP